MGYPWLRNEFSGSNAVRSPAAAVSMNPTLESLDQKISKYIGGNPVRIDGSPKASGILETVSSTVVQSRRSLSHALGCRSVLRPPMGSGSRKSFWILLSWTPS